MNENINLLKILRGHEGEIFYCSYLGINVILKKLNEITLTFNSHDAVENDITVFSNGAHCPQGECIIFPSKDQRDWNKWYKEKTHLKTWSNYVYKHYKDIVLGIGDYSIDIAGNRCNGWTRRNTSIEKSALALLKIHKLINVGYGGNISQEEWECPINTIYYIRTDGENFHIETNYNYPFCHIAFHTLEQAKEFLFYKENIQLLKDYFMI